MYLRVWQDETKNVDGQLRVRIYLDGVHDESNPGNNERKEHLKMIENGAKCFLVMCLAKDKDAPKREIKHYNKRNFFVVGGLVKEGKDIGLKLLIKL